DGAFYGPKLDFKLKDCIGRIWQCGTIQLDLNLPQRFALTYIDHNGQKQQPVMLHRACLGSLERFMGILIEHYAGIFPLWLAPVQLSILPVNEVHYEYSTKLNQLFLDHNLRSNIDSRNEKLGYKLREAFTNKIPYAIVVGDNEVTNNLVTYRKHGSQEQITISIDEFIKKLEMEIHNKE
ncbi:MAG: His/Gly/Thr/Pro-type tRNA ligase C-terminal domain-containing protein, partial [Bacilli bacterium]